MKCPHCSKEISNEASFCGFCGNTIPKEDNENAKAREVSATKAEPQAIKSKAKKKHTGLKVLSIFLVIALFAGGISGFLAARGVISFKSLIPFKQLKWTDFLEASTDIEPYEYTEDTFESEEKEKTDVMLSETSPLPTEKNTPFPEEATSPLENDISRDEHYAEFTALTLARVDDRAHVLSPTAMNNVLSAAKQSAFSLNSSVIVVITKDMSGMTNKEFLNEYHSHLIENSRGYPGQPENGYLVLLNLEGNECFIVNFGSKTQTPTDSKIGELNGIVQQYIAVENYEMAVTELIKNMTK